MNFNFCLLTQIITGIVLAMHYVAHADLAFASVEHIMRDVNYGWLMDTFIVMGHQCSF